MANLGSIGRPGDTGRDIRAIGVDVPANAQLARPGDPGRAVTKTQPWDQFPSPGTGAIIGGGISVR